jgi:hypothetical protein
MVPWAAIRSSHRFQIWSSDSYGGMWVECRSVVDVFAFAGEGCFDGHGC